MVPKRNTPCQSCYTLKCEHEETQRDRSDRPSPPNRLAGESSRWFGYLQSLPVGIVDLPIFWNSESPDYRSNDGYEAIKWLKGTQVERYMKRQSENSLKALVRSCSR